MRTRAPAALALAALLAAAAHSQPPAKDPPAKDKAPEVKWPTEIGGKSLGEWLKMLRDEDPAVRESALKVLPGFGPDVRKELGKTLLVRMRFASEGGENDPGVRITLFNTVAAIGFENKQDEADAVIILGRTVDAGAAGGLARQHAVVTLGMIGSKAGGAVTYLTGQALSDPSYETRRCIARTLGQVGSDDRTGPSLKALAALSGTLARDKSVAVRMEALQSLVVLGPPWKGVVNPKTKEPPELNYKGAGEVAENMRVRLGITKTKVPVETDPQVEIWCRVVLMRFDPKELNDDNLKAIARHLTPTAPAGPKVQALQALGLFGEESGSRVDDVVGVLVDKDPLVLTATLSTLAGMGVKARPAIPELKKTEQVLAKMRDDKLKEPEIVKLLAKIKDPEELQKARDSIAEEQARQAVVAAIKWIEESKPGKPGGDRPPPSPGGSPGAEAKAP
jgi:HEAT repeat protein